MLDIDKARAIRETILSDGEPSWGKSVIAGVEHPCWRVEGDGWNAILSSLWEIMSSVGAPGLEQGDRHSLIGREVMEVFVDDQRVMGFSYDDDSGSDHLYAFRPGAWEGRFNLQLLRSERSQAASRHRGFFPRTGLSTSSPVVRGRTKREADAKTANLTDPRPSADDGIESQTTTKEKALLALAGPAARTPSKGGRRRFAT
jgi:hypothetical protein